MNARDIANLIELLAWAKSEPDKRDFDFQVDTMVCELSQDDLMKFVPPDAPDRTRKELEWYVANLITERWRNG